MIVIEFFIQDGEYEPEQTCTDKNHPKYFGASSN